MRRSKPIYVETTIRTDMETLWNHTQKPELHRQWDLRFTDIAYLPRPNPEAPQRFTYATRIGFGLAIAGTGESRTARFPKSGVRLSALAFGSGQPLSLISRGTGYWKYVPPKRGRDAGGGEEPEEGSEDSCPNRKNDGSDGGIRFITQYDYRTRFGPLGRAFDRFAFRPLFGYATAWSFDALRLWLEAGIPPRVALRQAVVHYACAGTLACLWLAQGLLPKLLFPDAGELAILAATGWIPEGREPLAALLLGIGEAGLGLATLPLHRRGRFLAAQAPLLLLLAALGAAGDPALLRSPFNPALLGVGMAALSLAAALTARELAAAGRCLRGPRPKGGRAR
ncbi:DoxX-like family protein [Paenibacillus sp. UNC496MF]|uniref:DoxX-like family protein n=1 Tax=Paenibacillus sp. UNC496MF TaxID=1502753 RepID=UPI0008DFFF3A|nr:DoxX-like family protein [Paenibacillus sp. UNC496MF]SFI33675.1 DoxX-like family protein [Paenibacillus sp. UNC496MF]